MSQELILYAVWDAERQRYYADVLEARSCEALPLKAKEICRIDHEDKSLMLDWAVSRARLGWTPKQMRSACGGLSDRRKLHPARHVQSKQNAGEWTTLAQIKIDGTTENAEAEYEAFVEKFKPKKTTDDCYTPPEVYDAVAGFVANEYNLDKKKFVRPFWPGGDYQRYEYKPGDIVVDNPPFSIITSICKWYQDNGIKFFLFAPALTLFYLIRYDGVCAVVSNNEIVYENGAKVKTDFLTNLDAAKVRTAPALTRTLEEVEKARQTKPKLPVYQYPVECLTWSKVALLARGYSDFKLVPKECKVICVLDDQLKHKKKIYGAGVLIGEAAQERYKTAMNNYKRETYVWQLSEREKEIVKTLSP